jgi:hypothetical protein
MTALLSCSPPRFVRLSADEYFADPCETPSLSASIARKLVGESPRHAYAAHPRLGGKVQKVTKAMNAGSVMHALLLEGGKGLVECHYDNFLTKAAKEDRDQAIADGRTPVLARELAEARKVAAILKGKLVASQMVFDGETEIVALWTETADDGTVVPCRAMMDHWSFARAMVDDLKTSESADPGKIARSIADRGYDIQAAAYNSAATKIHPELVGRVQVSFGFCELEDPYATTVIERGRGGSFYELGEMRWRRAINTWAWCRNNNRWPEYASARIRSLDLPAYVMQRELDIQACGTDYAEAMRAREQALPTPPAKTINQEEYADEAGLF